MTDVYILYVFIEKTKHRMFVNNYDKMKWMTELINLSNFFHRKPESQSTYFIKNVRFLFSRKIRIFINKFDSIEINLAILSADQL